MPSRLAASAASAGARASVSSTSRPSRPSQRASASRPAIAADERAIAASSASAGSRTPGSLLGSRKIRFRVIGGGAGGASAMALNAPVIALNAPVGAGCEGPAP